jgi:hypothetical protein
MKAMMSTRLVAVALVALFSVAFTAPALANDDKKTIPVEMKFVGNVRNQPLFHMTFNSMEETEYTITVRDEYGNVLYKDKVKGGIFTKKFLLNTEEVEDSDLKFEVTGKGYDKPVVFEINKYTHFVEDIVISKTR